MSAKKLPPLQDDLDYQALKRLLVEQKKRVCPT